MDFSIKKYSAAHGEILFEGSCEQNIDAELSLPDYCADIQRILKCSAEISLRSVQHTGGRIVAEGDTVLRLLYVSEGESIDCFEQTVPLSCFSDIKAPEGSFCIGAHPSVEYLNCRAVSQRRANVNGKISVKFTVEQLSQSELVSGAEGAGVQINTEHVPIRTLLGMTDRTFEMTETVALADDEPSIGGIIHCGACAVPSSMKAITGKLLLKGDLNTQLVYFTDNTDREVVSKHHTMPISQIIELSGIDDDSRCVSDIEVVSVIIQPKADSTGANRLLDIVCRVRAELKAYEQGDAEVITDCYCTKHEMQCNYSTVELISAVISREDEKSVRSVIELGQGGISRPLEVWCPSITATACAGADGKTDGKASAVICMLYLDSEEKTVYAEKTVDFGFGFDLPEISGNLVCKPIAIPKDTSFTKVGTDKLEVKLNAYLSTTAYDMMTKRVCTEIELDEEHIKPRSKSALTLYFCEAGEKIWDIAKNYSTSVDAICCENGLDGSETPEKSMLLIPMA